MAKKQKKKIHWKRWFLLIIIVLVVALYYSWGIGAGSGSYLAALLTKVLPTDQQKTMSTKEKIAQNDERKILYMRFIGDMVEIDGINYSTLDGLERDISRIRKKYQGQSLIVDYLPKVDDPYYKFLKIKELFGKNHFSFVCEELEKR